MKDYFRRVFIPSLFALLAGAGLATAATWVTNPGNPVITIGQTIPYMLWNDPTVIKDGPTYRMWISGGSLTNLNSIYIAVFQATSSDGLSWNISPVPNVSPDPNPSRWDGLRIETPSVVKVGQTYHMYYSGTNTANATAGTYQIGHATSPDGTQWTKDPANPVVTGQVTNSFQWGYQGVGEPGIVYNPANKTYYLYYSGMKYDSSNPTLGLAGILLSTSKDGSKFSPVLDHTGQRELILTRNIPGALSGSWFGYSSPGAYIDSGGTFHLFCSFLVAQESQTNARQVFLTHSVSTNGINYSLLEDDLFPVAQGNWQDQNVRSPSPLLDNGVLKMWYAGDSYVPSYFSSGIGYAVQH